MKTEIWYSVENGGDGSAYPIFMESEKLADWHQEYLYEGWGEPCIGSLVIEHEGVINITKVHTANEMKEEMEKWKECDEDPKKYKALLELIENNNA